MILDLLRERWIDDPYAEKALAAIPEMTLMAVQLNLSDVFPPKKLMKYDEIERLMTNFKEKPLEMEDIDFAKGAIWSTVDKLHLYVQKKDNKFMILTNAIIMAKWVT